MAKNNNGKKSPLQETVYRFCQNRVSLIGLVILIALILMMVLAPVIADPALATKQNIPNRLKGPSAEHIFGTDGFGRDIFARVVHGAKYTMFISISSVLLADIVGVILGACAALYSTWFDEVLMRILDVFQAIPGMLMAMAIVAALGTSLPNLVIAMMISRVPGATRSSRAVMLNIVNQEHIAAARSYGSKDYQLIFRHIIPNAIGPIIISFTISLAATTLQVSSLSDIGLGVQPPTPEWGVLLSEAREFMRIAPHTIIFPGLMIMLAALAFNLVGDGLRDALDPKLRD